MDTKKPAGYKEHPKYKGVYASKSGKVIGVFGGVLTPYENSKGYHRVKVQGKDIFVHKFVWEAYKGLVDSSDGLTINHIDGNKANNSLSNLRRVSMSENAQHARDTGLR
jgi:hypothetical protein